MVFAGVLRILSDVILPDIILSDIIRDRYYVYYQT